MRDLTYGRGFLDKVVEQAAGLSRRDDGGGDGCDAIVFFQEGSSVRMLDWPSVS
jgi:hypothetical protein